MKYIFRSFVLLALLLASRSAQTAGAATSGYRYTGRSAQINYSSGEGPGCVYSEVWVFAGMNMSDQPPGPASASSEVLVSITYLNSCTGISFSVYGSAPLSESDFQIDRKLDSATLTAIVPVSNADASLSFDALINLTWTPKSPLGHQDEHSRIRFDGYYLNHHAKGDFRYAQVSGSVSDGTTNFLADPSLAWGFLYNARESTLSREPAP